MVRKRWTVVVEWESSVCEDADEVSVYAASASGAASAARTRWLIENKAEIDAGRLMVGSVFVLTPARRREFA